MPSRRDLITSGARLAAGAAAGSLFPPSIQRALSIPANQHTGSVQDVRHVVILMMENRGFDHYFGTLKGVRGFGDRHPVPLQSGKPAWFQSDGTREIPPYHLDTATTNAIRVPGTPHNFRDAQAAWNQGKFGLWPKFKTQFSMGHYRRADLPYQFALAEAFTICDAYHCSVTTGTDPNRIMFWSGSNADPAARARGENATPANSEPDNLRCWIKGALPEPGYTYAGSSLTWPTIPKCWKPPTSAGASTRIPMTTGRGRCMAAWPSKVSAPQSQARRSMKRACETGRWKVSPKMRARDSCLRSRGYFLPCFGPSIPVPPARHRAPNSPLKFWMP